MSALGEFELLVALSILRQADTPYANRVREDLKQHAGRRVTRGALYRTLDRLTEKGSSPDYSRPARFRSGGYPMRRLLVTEAGLDAALGGAERTRHFL